MNRKPKAFPKKFSPIKSNFIDDEELESQAIECEERCVTLSTRSKPTIFEFNPNIALIKFKEGFEKENVIDDDENGDLDIDIGNENNPSRLTIPYTNELRPIKKPNQNKMKQIDLSSTNSKITLDLSDQSNYLKDSLIEKKRKLNLNIPTNYLKENEEIRECTFKPKVNQLSNSLSNSPKFRMPTNKLLDANFQKSTKKTSLKSNELYEEYFNKTKNTEFRIKEVK